MTDLTNDAALQPLRDALAGRYTFERVLGAPLTPRNRA
jgi:hypothetical protein